MSPNKPRRTGLRGELLAPSDSAEIGGKAANNVVYEDTWGGSISAALNPYWRRLIYSWSRTCLFKLSVLHGSGSLPAYSWPVCLQSINFLLLFGSGEKGLAFCSCLLLGFYVVRYVRTETVNYGKWALMPAFRSKQYYRCQVSQAKKRCLTAPFSCSHWGAAFAKVFFQRIIRHFRLRDLSLDIYFWGSKVLLWCGAWMKSHTVRFLKRRNLDMGSWEEILENLTSKLLLQQVVIYGLIPDSK